MTLRQINARLSALLLSLALALAALAMGPMAPSTQTAAPHAHAQHMPTLSGELAPGADAPRDLACAIGCIGGTDPAIAPPLVGLARRAARLAHAAEAPQGAGHAPAPPRHPPRRSAIT
ncbi:MAG: hypothetical protein K0B00_06165 [Rhodobacteraceae bacterium]|nr:hypothetical protein [Paracoccaceae bacterium]